MKSKIEKVNIEEVGNGDVIFAYEPSSFKEEIVVSNELTDCGRFYACYTSVVEIARDGKREKVCDKLVHYVPATLVYKKVSN